MDSSQLFTFDTLPGVRGDLPLLVQARHEGIDLQDALAE
jgi:hypothetical protein